MSNSNVSKYAAACVNVTCRHWWLTNWISRNSTTNIQLVHAVPELAHCLPKLILTAAAAITLQPMVWFVMVAAIASG